MMPPSVSGEKGKRDRCSGGEDLRSKHLEVTHGGWGWHWKNSIIQNLFIDTSMC